MNKILVLGIGLAVVVAITVGVLVVNRGSSVTNPLLPLQEEIKVGEDVCAEFPKEWVQSVINKPVTMTESMGSGGTHVCQYYTDDRSFITLRLNGLSYENQKKGQQALGRTITTTDKIPLTHFIAMQEDNIINDIVLEINPNLFLAVDRSSLKAADETEIVNFAVKVAERIQNGENQGTSSPPTIQPTIKSSADTVPLPQDKDILNSFLRLIDEGKASSAVMMMTSATTNDDSTKQAYGVQFNAMKSVNVTKIQESSVTDWTDTRHQYMVTLDVEMDPSSATAPIPYYGYEKGENVRFITLVKEGTMWKIEGIATGP